MRTRLSFILLFFSTFLPAQIQPELTPTGFAAVEIPIQNRPVEDLIQIARGWASSYNKKGVDVFDVTANSLSIEAIRENAYFYINRGETYSFDVRYTLKAVFLENNTCRLSFSVKEIYDNGKLLKTTVADFFAPDGRLKEDFEEVKPSLETTASKILNSFAGRFQD